MSSFQQQQKMKHINTKTFISGVGGSNCLWTWPDVGFKKQRLQNSNCKYVQRIKGNWKLTSKERYNDNATSNWEYQ